MTSETFVNIVLTGKDAYPLITDIQDVQITFTCICAYADNNVTSKAYYICPNCQRIYILSVGLMVYNPQEAT